MHIGLVTPFNPAAFASRLGPEAPKMHPGATAVHILAQELLAQGHTLSVFTSYPGRGPVKTWSGEGLTVRAVPRGGSIPLHGTRRAVARRLRKLMAPYIEGMDVLHAQWTYEYALAASAFSGKIPTFCSVRDWAPYQLEMSTSWQFKLYWRQSVGIMREVLKDNKITFIANSEYTRSCLRSWDSSLPVVLLPNPVQEDFILTERSDYPATPVVVSICQSMDARKNIGTLLEAFQLYRQERPEAQLHLGGKDFYPDHPKLRPYAELMEGVTLHGWLERDDLKDLLDSASALVLPSLEETFGNVLLEGMARRVEVIGGRASGAVPAVLGQGKYGILCDVTSPEALCAALVQAEDRAHVDAATAMLKEKYAAGALVRRHLELYENGRVR